MFDIVPNAFKLGGVSHPMVERFILPKGFAGAAQRGISVACGNSFHYRGDFRKWRARLHQYVDVVRHDHIGIQVVPAKLGSAQDRVFAGSPSLTSLNCRGRTKYLANPPKAESWNGTVRASWTFGGAEVLWRSAPQVLWKMQTHQECPPRRITPLECTLTKNGLVSPLEFTVTNSLDLKSPGIRAS